MDDKIRARLDILSVTAIWLEDHINDLKKELANTPKTNIPAVEELTSNLSNLAKKCVFEISEGTALVDYILSEPTEDDD